MVCEDTEVVAANLRITLNQLKTETEVGRTGFQKQFQVMCVCGLPYSVCMRCDVDSVWSLWCVCVSFRLCRN